MVKGFKVFNPDWTCSPNGHRKQYTCPGKFEEDVTPVRCGRGMHFCKVAADCFNYYTFDPDNKVAEIIAYGDIAEEGNKCCTNKLEIVREIPWDELLTIVNTGKGNIGLCNAGDWNTGNRNTGNWNTGNRNTGNRNAGDWNTGNWNTGDGNTGDWNTGNGNTGDRNTGDFNSTDRETGCFCTVEHPIRFFDKESNITFKEWRGSKAYALLCRIRCFPTEWISACDMTNEEKAAHPEFKTTGGYLKANATPPAFRDWWQELNEEEKAVIRRIPNFDPEKFKQITGISV
jgi:hypothetical protein